MSSDDDDTYNLPSSTSKSSAPLNNPATTSGRQPFNLSLNLITPVKTATKGRLSGGNDLIQNISSPPMFRSLRANTTAPAAPSTLQHPNLLSSTISLGLNTAKPRGGILNPLASRNPRIGHGAGTLPPKHAQLAAALPNAPADQPPQPSSAPAVDLSTENSSSATSRTSLNSAVTTQPSTRSRSKAVLQPPSSRLGTKLQSTTGPPIFLNEAAGDDETSVDANPSMFQDEKKQQLYAATSLAASTDTDQNKTSENSRSSATSPREHGTTSGQSSIASEHTAQPTTRLPQTVAPSTASTDPTTSAVSTNTSTSTSKVSKPVAITAIPTSGARRRLYGALPSQLGFVLSSAATTGHAAPIQHLSLAKHCWHHPPPSVGQFGFGPSPSRLYFLAMMLHLNEHDATTTATSTSLTSTQQRSLTRSSVRRNQNRDRSTEQDSRVDQELDPIETAHGMNFMSLFRSLNASNQMLTNFRRILQKHLNSHSRRALPSDQTSSSMGEDGTPSSKRSRALMNDDDQVDTAPVQLLGVPCLSCRQLPCICAELLLHETTPTTTSDDAKGTTKGSSLGRLVEATPRKPSNSSHHQRSDSTSSTSDSELFASSLSSPSSLLKQQQHSHTNRSRSDMRRLAHLHSQLFKTVFAAQCLTKCDAFPQLMHRIDTFIRSLAKLNPNDQFWKNHNPTGVSITQLKQYNRVVDLLLKQTTEPSISSGKNDIANSILQNQPCQPIALLESLSACSGQYFPSIGSPNNQLSSNIQHQLDDPASMIDIPPSQTFARWKSNNNSFTSDVTEVSSSSAPITTALSEPSSMSTSQTNHSTTIYNYNSNTAISPPPLSSEQLLTQQQQQQQQQQSLIPCLSAANSQSLLLAQNIGLDLPHGTGQDPIYHLPSPFPQILISLPCQLRWLIDSGTSKVMNICLDPPLLLLSFFYATEQSSEATTSDQQQSTKSSSSSTKSSSKNLSTESKHDVVYFLLRGVYAGEVLPINVSTIHLPFTQNAVPMICFSSFQVCKSIPDLNEWGSDSSNTCAQSEVAIQRPTQTTIPQVIQQMPSSLLSLAHQKSLSNDLTSFTSTSMPL